MPQKRRNTKKRAVIWDKRRYPRKKKKFFSFTRNMQDPAYKDWRKKVFLRDKRRCRYMECGSKDRVSAHHILPWSKYPSMRFEVGNGITLCFKHHKMVTGRELEFVSIFHNIIITGLKEKRRGNKSDN